MPYGNSGIRAGWELVQSHTVTTKGDSFDFAPTLNGDVDGEYEIRGRVVNDEVGATDVILRINGASFAGNRQFNQSSSTTISGARDTTAAFAGAGGSGGVCNFIVYFTAALTGDIRHMQAKVTRDATTAVFMHEMGFDVTTPSAATNITSLGIGVSNTDSLGVGSVLTLYRRIN